MSQTFDSIDPAKLPKHFESEKAEKRWDEKWQESGIYHWDPARPREETFVVDTPPPTVSGSLHVGHVFSYTQTDVLVRYKRMRGFNTFYPMGWDDNGLPTERRVQNFYHVRCEPGVPYEENLQLEQATAKQRKDRPKLLSRENFIELCDVLTKVDEEAYLDMFKRLGLSVDWRQEYATIDEHCRRIAQRSFLDLVEKDMVYQSGAPTMWDVDFQSAVAQAEVEDREMPGAYHHLEFAIEGEEVSFVIATTRPELLPACVGVTAHPDDERYKPYFGKNAVTPLFYAPVPIFPSELADPEKGSGILMVCTFGDQTDVHWWQEQKLPMRQILGRGGRLTEVNFGSEEYPSLKPEKAQAYYDQIMGKNVKQAQKAIVELLRDPEGSATGNSAPLQKEPENIQHMVKFFEKGERPLELVPTRQWFVRLMDRKDQLLEKGKSIYWHPGFMHSRFQDWTQNLGLDWCLSRQRYFGVPIPVWYPIDGQGEPDFDKPIFPKADQVPLDPMTSVPEGYTEEQRDQPGGFVGEADIFDTWFTSSMTPQISSHWTVDGDRHSKLFPADVRPQGHDIIRTWAFYTIAKAMLHEDKLPWNNILLSGWILDPDRKKMSKSKGNTVTPMNLIEKFSADAVRYWAASARLGVDTAYDEKVFKVGHRLTTKLFNAGKFVLSQQAEVHPISCELDKVFIAKLRELVERTTKYHEEFDYAHGLMETENFFWTHFTDTYLELSKARAWGNEGVSPEEQGSAIAALRIGLATLLRLFAPILPYITEEIWSWVFAKEHGSDSIHTAAWPELQEYSDIAAPEDENSFELAVACYSAINKSKTLNSVSVGRRIDDLTLCANTKTLEKVAPILEDVLSATRCDQHQLEAKDSLEDAEFEIASVKFKED